MTGVRAHLSSVLERTGFRPGLGSALRLGVVACVAAACATTAARFDDVLGLYDLHADTNSASTYDQRAHTYPGWSAAGGRVLEDARLWMPEDATYRVVLGTEFDEVRSEDFTRHMLLWYLLPRRPTASRSAKWVFCYGCDDAVLEEVRVLSSAEGGPVFGRLLR